ncbi:JmjC domain-containing protein [Kribbella sp. NPDC048928]|uniref:JmjC domain-containing protein n=1 Tax=Kribbella sp. NPDC048928 TaxID=3364111 RepID=UPI003723D29A
MNSVQPVRQPASTTRVPEVRRRAIDDEAADYIAGRPPVSWWTPRLAELLGVTTEADGAAIFASTDPVLVQSPQTAGFDLADFAERLSNVRADWPRMRMAAAGKTLPPDDFCLKKDSPGQGELWYLNSFAVRENLAAGATLVIDSVQEISPFVRSCALAIGRYFGASVQANMYISERSDSAFNWHQDGHATIIQQLQGSKNWELEPKLVTKGNRTLIPRVRRGASLELSVGQAMFVPHGYWHNVTARQGRSVHVTYALPVFNQARFVREHTAALVPPRNLPPGEADGSLTTLAVKAADVARWEAVRRVRHVALPMDAGLIVGDLDSEEHGVLELTLSAGPVIRPSAVDSSLVDVITMANIFTMGRGTCGLLERLLEPAEPLLVEELAEDELPHAYALRRAGILRWRKLPAT